MRYESDGNDFSLESEGEEAAYREGLAVGGVYSMIGTTLIIGISGAIAFYYLS